MTLNLLKGGYNMFHKERNRFTHFMMVTGMNQYIHIIDKVIDNLDLQSSLFDSDSVS